MNARPHRTVLRAALEAALLHSPLPVAETSATAAANRALLASLIVGQSLGDGILPAHLGLGDAAFAELLTRFGFPVPESDYLRPQPELPEWDELHTLLIDHRAGHSDAERWIASILTTACVGADHLWQDLGLKHRNELSLLLTLNFPSLAAANTGDMKWKKFLYRQFCAREGIYVCPAPSCAACADYSKCFAPEV